LYVKTMPLMLQASSLPGKMCHAAEANGGSGRNRLPHGRRHRASRITAPSKITFISPASTPRKTRATAN
jgi:hypothetical protein